MDIDCSNLDLYLVEFCLKVKDRLSNNVEEKLDDVQTQIYIISGVLGGAALILMICCIALAIQLSSLRRKANFLGNSSGKPKSTPDSGFPPKNSANNGENSQQLRQQPPPHSYAQSPKNMTSEEELAQLGFSAYTGHPVDSSRGMSTSPAVNSAGGVRVLPRNPPTGFRNNGAFNDGYM